MSQSKEKHTAYMRVWRKRNLEKHAAYMRLWRARNPEKAKATYERFLKNNPGYYRRSIKEWKENNYGRYLKAKRRERLKRYGLTEESLKKLTLQHKNQCAICKKKTKQLQIDHCHTSGKVRGLLCPPCNRGLGLFFDNTKFLKSAVKYLSKIRRR